MLDYAAEHFVGRGIYAQGDGLSMEFDLNSREAQLIRQLLCSDEVYDCVVDVSGQWAN
jgi:hypothetical protein